MNKNEFEIGLAYYEIGYFDEAMTVPEILTHIYIGQDIIGFDENDTSTKYLFQDAESFYSVGNFFNVSDKSLCSLLKLNEKTLFCIKDLDGLVEEIVQLKNTGSGLKKY